MDELYRKKPVHSDAQMPLLNQEEEKQQSQPSEVRVPAEEEKKYPGLLRV